MNKSASEIIETAEFYKDTKKKRPINLPIFDKDLIAAKIFASSAETNVLIYDKNAEFIIRNKILETFLRLSQNEVDSKAIFKQFNEKYDYFIDGILRLEDYLTFNFSFADILLDE